MSTLAITTIIFNSVIFITLFNFYFVSSCSARVASRPRSSWSRFLRVETNLCLVFSSVTLAITTIIFNSVIFITLFNFYFVSSCSARVASRPRSSWSRFLRVETNLCLVFSSVTLAITTIIFRFVKSYLTYLFLLLIMISAVYSLDCSLFFYIH